MTGIVVSGCSKPGEDKYSKGVDNPNSNIHSGSYYSMNLDEAKRLIAECEHDPSKMKNDENCTNAKLGVDLHG